MELIVAHFEEDVRWTNDVRCPVNIYSKGSRPPKDAIVLPNVGRESQSYLTYIVSRYDSLPDWSVFVQGYPFDHYPKVINKLSSWPPSTSFEGQNGFIPIGKICSLHPHEAPEDEFAIWRYNVVKKLWKWMTPNVSIPARLSWSWGAMFGVTREFIRSRPVGFYKVLLEMHNSLFVLPWSLENLWPHVLIPDHYFKTCYLHL